MSNHEETLIEQVRRASQHIFERELLEAEKQYLRSRYPYVMIANIDAASIDPAALPTKTYANNYWPILDYGDYIISGCSEIMAYLLQQQGLTDDDRGGQGGKGGPGGFGTIVQQFTDVAFEIVQMAIARGWNGVNIPEGYYSMSRMAWIACEIKQIHCTFKPTLEDMVVRNWLIHMHEKTFYPHSHYPKYKGK